MLSWDEGSIPSASIFSLREKIAPWSAGTGDQVKMPIGAAAVDILGAGAVDAFGTSLIAADLNVSGVGELLV